MPIDHFTIAWQKYQRTDDDFTSVMQQYAREHMQIVELFDGTRCFKWSSCHPGPSHIERYDRLHPDAPFRTLMP